MEKEIAKTHYTWHNENMSEEIQIENSVKKTCAECNGVPDCVCHHDHRKVFIYLTISLLLTLLVLIFLNGRGIYIRN